MAEDIFTKGILLILNFLFMGVGGGLIALGVIGVLAVKELEEPNLAGYQTVPIVFIAVGAFVFLVGFMGCCGAVADSNCILAVYAIFKVLLMILFLGAGILVFVKQQMFVDYIMQFERDLFDLNSNKFARLELKFHCCGPEGVFSYSGDPSSACCVDELCSDYHPKCSKVTAELVHNYGKYIGGGFIGIASLELLGAVMSLCLASMIRRDSKY